MNITTLHTDNRIESLRDRQHRRILDVVIAGPRHRATTLAREHLLDFPDDEEVRAVLDKLEGRTSTVPSCSFGSSGRSTSSTTPATRSRFPVPA